MHRVIALLACLAGCGGTPTKKETPPPAPPLTIADYVLDTGRYEARGMFRTGELALPWSLVLDITCAEQQGGKRCKTVLTRTINQQQTTYESVTVERADGIHEIEFKDEKGQRTHDSLELPALDRMPTEWTSISADGNDNRCRGERHTSICPDGIHVVCETTAIPETVTVDSRVMCPDGAKTLHRHVSTYSALCELVIDVSYDNWQGTDTTANSAAQRTVPRACKTASPLGWTRQTPNRDWSIAMPSRGRMVLGPDKHTVNLHIGDMSFIAYEGTGANASVKTDADVPTMRAELERTVAPVLGVKVGEPVKRDDPMGVDWLIPMTKDGKFAGAQRLVYVSGRFFSVFAAGPDESQAMAFINSLQLHDEAFAAKAKGLFADYVVRGKKYKDTVCACKDMACARAVPDLTAPTLAFPTAEEEAAITELAKQIGECARRLGAQPAP